MAVQAPTTTFNMGPSSLTRPAGYPAQVKAKLIIPAQAGGLTPLFNTLATSPSTTPELILTTSSPPSPIMDSDIDPRLLAEASIALVNLHLERANVNSEKKRKPESKTVFSTNKRQKTKAVGLAIPDLTNSLRYFPHSYFTNAQRTFAELSVWDTGSCSSQVAKALLLSFTHTSGNCPLTPER